MKNTPAHFTAFTQHSFHYWSIWKLSHDRKQVKPIKTHSIASTGDENEQDWSAQASFFLRIWECVYCYFCTLARIPVWQLVVTLLPSNKRVQLCLWGLQPAVLSRLQDQTRYYRFWFTGQGLLHHCCLVNQRALGKTSFLLKAPLHSSVAWSDDGTDESPRSWPASAFIADWLQLSSAPYDWLSQGSWRNEETIRPQANHQRQRSWTSLA